MYSFFSLCLIPAGGLKPAGSTPEVPKSCRSSKIILIFQNVKGDICAPQGTLRENAKYWSQTLKIYFNVFVSIFENIWPRILNLEDSKYLEFRFLIFKFLFGIIRPPKMNKIIWGLVPREAEDIRLFITLVPKVLQ